MTHERILIVEDEVIVAMELESRLSRLGYHVVGSVRSGEEAVETARRERPDIVLMDIKLSGAMDGIAAAAAISAALDIPVVYLSAYADDETLRRAKTAEPFGYLVKPFEERELHTALEIALHQHRLIHPLRESETRYRSLFDQAGDAIFLLGAEGEDAGTIVDANRAAAEMYGYGQRELVGMNIRDLGDPSDAAGAAALLSRVLAGGRLRSETTRRRKDGTFFRVETSVSPLTLAGKRCAVASDRVVGARAHEEGQPR